MNKYAIGVMTLAIITALTVAVPTFAETNGSVNVGANANAATNMRSGEGNPGRGQAGIMKPFVLGTVSSVSGNTIAVLGHTGLGKTTTATTTFTVDATNAKIMKSNATSSVSSIVVGDTVVVQGTITGTNVVATMIRDGIMTGPGVGFGRGQDKTSTSTNPVLAGNGQPIVAGMISTINGSTITITNKSNVVYTIDATNAKFLQGNKTVDLSILKTGNAVVVQGTINGTSIVASSIIDQTKPANPGNGAHFGFFGGIGQFFMHLFGF
jgi:hypothetical protein